MVDRTPKLLNSTMFGISIVTVSLNSAETLEHCIESVAEQNVDDIEHIIVDGGSTDGTGQIIERYRAELEW